MCLTFILLFSLGEEGGARERLVMAPSHASPASLSRSPSANRSANILFTLAQNLFGVSVAHCL